MLLKNQSGLKHYPTQIQIVTSASAHNFYAAQEVEHRSNRPNNVCVCTLGGSLNIWSRQINSRLGSNSMNWEKDSSLMAWQRTRVRSTRRLHLDWSEERKRQNVFSDKVHYITSMLKTRQIKDSSKTKVLIGFQKPFLLYRQSELTTNIWTIILGPCMT